MIEIFGFRDNQITTEIERDNTARSFTAPALEAFSREFCQRHAVKPKELFMLLRVAVTGLGEAVSVVDEGGQRVWRAASRLSRRRVAQPRSTRSASARLVTLLATVN